MVGFDKHVPGRMVVSPPVYTNKGLAYRVAVLKHHCSTSRNVNYCSNKVIFLCRWSGINCDVHDNRNNGIARTSVLPICIYSMCIGLCVFRPINESDFDLINLTVISIAVLPYQSNAHIQKVQ